MWNDISDLQRIKEGDGAAFERLFRRYYKPLCIYAASITGRMDVSEEIVQELFFVLWKEKERLTILQSLKSYLFGSVRNRSLQYCEHLNVVERHREAAMAAEQSEATPHEEMEYAELESLVNNTLDRLPQRRSLIFKMHRIEGLKYSEIALKLSVSVKTVEAEMTQALRTLRKEVEKYIKQK